MHSPHDTRTSSREGEMGEDPKSLSIDTSSVDYDYLARSPLLEHDHGLSSSGLPRIRQSSRAPSLPFALTSSSSIQQLSQSQPNNNHNNNKSTIPSTHPSDGTVSPGVEDLYRFPSESLHSFSFAKQSDDLLNNRQNLLKRSIDFLRDRIGLHTNDSGQTDGPAQMSDENEIQWMMDILSRSNLLGSYDAANHSVGPATGPSVPEAGGNIFDRAFGAYQTYSPAEIRSPQDRFAGREQQHLSPVTLERATPRTRGRKSAPSSRRVSLKRTFTDIGSLSQHGKSMGAITEPYSAVEFHSNRSTSSFGFGCMTPTMHVHSGKSSLPTQAVFTTETKPKWTILAANDLACLIFGVTQCEFRKISILDLIQRERREWLASKLQGTQIPTPESDYRHEESPRKAAPGKLFGLGSGVTAQLLSKPPSRVTRKANALNSSPSSSATSDSGNGNRNGNNGTKQPKNPNHSSKKSRGVLLCGEVVPIQKRNGTTGSASLWVMEKRGGLIWVVEEITEHAVTMEFDDRGRVTSVSGDSEQIWDRMMIQRGSSIFKLLPNVPERFPTGCGKPDFSKINEQRHFTAFGARDDNSIPLTLTPVSGSHAFRISCFPHIAGMMVLCAKTLKIISANSAFTATLFGDPKTEGSQVTDLLPHFDEFLSILTEQDDTPLVDGVVISEHGFRRARALFMMRHSESKLTMTDLRPVGLPACHKDGSKLTVDVQMRVVKSKCALPENSKPTSGSDRSSSSEGDNSSNATRSTEDVFALWVSYSRQLHSPTEDDMLCLPNKARKVSEVPPISPGQVSPVLSAQRIPQVESPSGEPLSQSSLLTQQLTEAASEPLVPQPLQRAAEARVAVPANDEVPTKKSISDYVILEDMGEGAYGQVKLTRSRRDPSKKVVLKYVTKNRILVDTWTRDRVLGTVPLEIHVLNFLRREGNRHPNIVEMEGFFEDDVNYYIEMVPHGLPGMDLFDYVELRANMEQDECRNIFYQVASAIDHLHNKASVVHRDIKDENVILDGEGRIKLIDFGSAAYIRSGPFDVFVGTIDYAAPEVLQGKPYLGKEQDVWALGILLYTIIYKENPFYNINEIMDHPLRVPFLPFTDDCLDLIRRMLDRNVQTRISITEVMNHPWMKLAANGNGNSNGAAATSLPSR
ncbi:CAMK/CAMKL/PASK protein kinase [Trichophyton violaceum]|uniref:non-specific serine/threonine protein kinase n=1 Tax=Trichophyton violaceum TaxID=34388 RepID=A0A178FNB2_TRIVO|nr:CAMK/CAMKL/PASK protein kinase [Trichophyton violaceum]